jgi:hypothetical protein
LCLFVGVALPANIAAQTASTDLKESMPVDYFEQWELPVSVSNASVVRKQNQASLIARLANRAEEGIGGVAFVLILLDSQRTVMGRITWVEKLDLDVGELREVSLRLPKDIKVPRHGRLVLGIDEMFGNRSIWITLKLHEALEAFGTGTPYKQPAIKRVSNTVDSRP